MASADAYKADFRKEVQGKPPHNVTEAYPEYEHLRKVGKMASQVNGTNSSFKFLIPLSLSRMLNNMKFVGFKDRLCEGCRKDQALS